MTDRPRNERRFDARRIDERHRFDERRSRDERVESRDRSRSRGYEHRYHRADGPETYPP